ncbi:MAG: DUF6504 family protein [Actinomycetota bacterium]
MSKKYNEAIYVEMAGVEVAGGALQPVSFAWRGRHYSIQRLLKYWREAGEAWDPERIRDHEIFRVEADGGTYDLRHDRTKNSKPQASVAPGHSWLLIRVWD